MIFRELNKAEEADFKQWARDNYKIGTPIKYDVWHPVVCKECEAINKLISDSAKAEEHYTLDELEAHAELDKRKKD